MDCFDSVLTRRRFLEFLGRGTAAAAFGQMGLAGCVSRRVTVGGAERVLISGIEPSTLDEVVLAPGLQYRVLIGRDDPVGPLEVGNRFGDGNDFTCFIPLDKGDEGILWVNHEHFKPLFIFGRLIEKGAQRNADEVKQEQQYVGASILKMRLQAGEWRVIADHPSNRRITAATPIPFSGHHEIAGKRVAIGTLGNCSGGLTPWKTVLSCEELYDDFYGEVMHFRGRAIRNTASCEYGWETVFHYPPEHYGWVVEVNPITGEASKLVALGRFAHECATVATTADGRAVVYSGDDEENCSIYKFIASQPGSLEQGELFVADLERGKWVTLSIDKQPRLKKVFKDQLEVLIFARKAGELVGGTGLGRPEDIKIDPETGNVFAALTTHRIDGEQKGAILKLEQEAHDSLFFKHSVFHAGGPHLVWPDNLAFDHGGNLWVASDMPGSELNRGSLAPYGNNGLFVIPLRGEHAGKAIQIASAPTEAEFTGISFTGDGRTAFVSVQHPGECSTHPSSPRSRWPDGKSPRSAVIAISGPALNALCSG